MGNLVFSCLSLVLVLLCSMSQMSNAIAVMSVDLGSEWMKIGIVSPGVPMEIVLNKESKRKTPVAVSFRNGERLIGEDALNVAVRFPSNAYIYFMDLLGKKLDNPMVKLFQSRFPQYKLVSDPVRETVSFQHDSETTYSPEELLGMVLNQAREYAQDFAQQPVKEAVITVPPYFNQAERRAVMQAADLAGIKVLQLMNTNTASALNYGIFRSSTFNETPQHLLLYDMGTSSTVATIIKYQVAKTKEKGHVETNPQLSVLGVGYDRTLGGLEMQIRLRDYLGKAFNGLKKTSTDVFTNHRALAKLFKEAGRVKNVLSANTDHYAQVEGLLEEKDFKTAVSREHFEKLCSDLFERVTIPVEQALNAAAVTMDVIDQVILVGAGTRVPKVQEKLSSVFKRELGKSLNTDEAAAMGAVYKAADLSTGFKVKKFITKDAVLFPILVDFERELGNDEGSPKGVKVVRRVLFSHMNPYPQKKILTFNKHIDDFSFYVSYGDLPVSGAEALAVGSVNISKVDLKGVGSSIQKNSVDGTEFKGVKAHFSLDDSGLLSLTLVESVFEKNTTEIPAVEEDTLSKLGSAFSKLFSSSSDESGSKSESGSEEKSSTGDSTSGDQTVASDKSDGGKGTDTSNANESTTDSSDGKKTDAKNDSKIPEKTVEPPKPKIVTVKENIELHSVLLDIAPLDGVNFDASANKLKLLNEIDRNKVLREKARNLLESYVSNMQDKIMSSEFESFLTNEEREKISTTCSEISDWLYEDGAEADKAVYEEKLKSLKLLTKDFNDRMKEHKDRPDALENLDKMLNISHTFLQKSKELPEDLQYFTEVEINALEKIVIETEEWKMKQMDEQANTPLSQPPVLTVRSIADKIDSLDREVKYMMNKARVEKLKKQREEAAKAKEEEKNKSKESPVTEETPEDTSAQEESPDSSSTSSPYETEENKAPEDQPEPTPSTKDESSHTEL